MDTPLRKLRLARGKTLMEVAIAVKSDTGNLSRIESGKQKSLVLAARLVEYYGRDAISETDILYPERAIPVKKRRREPATAL